MNKEKLNERIALLTAERDQLLNQIHAYSGAIQECQHWLAQMEEEES